MNMMLRFGRAAARVMQRAVSSIMATPEALSSAPG